MYTRTHTHKSRSWARKFPRDQQFNGKRERLVRDLLVFTRKFLHQTTDHQWSINGMEHLHFYAFTMKILRVFRNNTRIFSGTPGVSKVSPEASHQSHAGPSRTAETRRKAEGFWCPHPKSLPELGASQIRNTPSHII